MYNDYYLQQIDNKMAVNNQILTEIQEKVNSYENIKIQNENLKIIGAWILLFISAIFFYHYFHTIFKIRGAK